MDVLLETLDPLLLDAVYEHVASPLAALLPYEVIVRHLLSRGALLRQCISLFVVSTIGAISLYLILATATYYLLFDHTHMQHPKYLKNQIRREIALSLRSLPIISLLLLPLLVGEARGHSMLYRNVSDYGWPYLILSVVLFLFFTDMCIYWIHRWLHHPRIYAYIHKPHHTWKIPTPFAAYAFHPLDGALQGVPYQIFPFLFPLHVYLSLALFGFVMAWTVFIHDGAYFVAGTFINGAAHHTIHHLEFNFNYGQYFTLWDRIGKSHRVPTAQNTMKQSGKYKVNQPSVLDTAGVIGKREKTVYKPSIYNFTAMTTTRRAKIVRDEMAFFIISITTCPLLFHYMDITPPSTNVCAASQAAAMQSNNNKLLISLHRLRGHLSNITQQIERHQTRKQELHNQINLLQTDLSHTDAELQQLCRVRNSVQTTLQETETNYQKVVDSSHALLQYVLQETSNLDGTVRDAMAICRDSEINK